MEKILFVLSLIIGQAAFAQEIQTTTTQDNNAGTVNTQYKKTGLHKTDPDLEPKAQQLDSVVVTANRGASRRKEVLSCH